MTDFAEELNEDIHNRFKESKEFVKQFESSNLSPEEIKIANAITEVFSQFESSSLKIFQLGLMNKDEEGINLYQSETVAYLKKLVILSEKLTNFHVNTSAKINKANE